MRRNNKPWFSLVTPEGPAGVAVWMLGGPGSEKLTSDFFVPNAKVSVGCTRNQALGFLKDRAVTSDEVLLVYPYADGSEKIFEMHGHGGSELAAMHRALFIRAGFEEISAKDTTLFPGKTRLVSHLYQLATLATTSRVCKAFLHQSRILPLAFEKLIQTCREGDSTAALAAVSDLESGWDFARRWLEPFRISVLGPPNAGKSSLLNYLAGKKRAVVSPIPGTTVDVIRVAMALEGWPIELCDTAGVRETIDEVEQQGIQLALNFAAGSDLVLWLLDSSIPNPQMPPGINCKEILDVWTKMDLVASPAGNLKDTPKLSISTLTGEGCHDLQAAMLSRLLKDSPVEKLEPVICSEELLSTTRQVQGSMVEGDFAGAANRLSWWMEYGSEGN